jgi:hypothetical protein
MAHIARDRVADTSVTTGTSDFTVAGSPPTGFRTLDNVLATSDTFWYCIAHQGAGEFEVGLGTYSGSGVFVRTTVLESSNSNNLVNFSAGTKDVFFTFPAASKSGAHFGLTVASAGTCDIGAVQSFHLIISGTTTITSFGSVVNQIRSVRFSGALTLTHNGTSLVLPGGANIATADGDTGVFASDASGNWRCISFQKVSGFPINAELVKHLSAQATVASAGTADIGAASADRVSISGTTTITSFGTSANLARFVTFEGVLTLTHHATSLILPGGANITTAAGDTAVFISDNSGNWRCISYQRATFPDPWAAQPIGVPIPVYSSLWVTLFDALPPRDRGYRYILLTAGEDGSGEYNEGVLDGESVSGSAPTNLATAVVNMAASVLDNKTVDLINTTRRFLRAGSVGTVENDQMQQITGTFGDWQRNTNIATGAFTNVGQSNVARGGANSVAFSGMSFDSANSSGARAGTETRAKNLGMNFVMRIL